MKPEGQSRRGTLFSLVAGVAAFLGGCGSSPGEIVTYEEPPAMSRELGGSLALHVRKVTEAAGAAACDRSQAPLRLEIAQAIDERSSALAVDALGSAGVSDYRSVRLGPTTVRELGHRVAMRAGWQRQEFGWSNLEAIYRRLAARSRASGDSSVADRRAWLALQGVVRELIRSDQDRVLYGVNVELDRDAGAGIGRLRSAVGACQAQGACVRPALSLESEAFVRGNSIYRALLDGLDRGGGRPALDAFLARLELDDRRFAFRVNPEVVRVSDQELELPLDVSDFRGAESPLSRIVESIWRESRPEGSELSLKIRWSVPSPLGVFRFVLGVIPGERSYVNPADRTIHLFPGVRTRSIAHEIGHVLGFADHYYSVWRPALCRYEEQFREDDLMSDSTVGEVTPEEWEQLRSAYSLGRASSNASPGRM